MRPFVCSSSGEDTFNNAPVKTVNGVRSTVVWDRPQNVALASYLALPMTPSVGKPVMRLSMDLTDVLSNYSVGGFFKSVQRNEQRGSTR